MVSLTVRRRAKMTPSWRVTGNSSGAEFPVPLLPAIVRESKEIEGLRSPFLACPALATSPSRCGPPVSWSSLSTRSPRSVR